MKFPTDENFSYRVPPLPSFDAHYPLPSLILEILVNFCDGGCEQALGKNRIDKVLALSVRLVAGPDKNLFKCFF